jgi:hypothetical protein
MNTLAGRKEGDVRSMPSHQHRAGIWVLLNGLLQAVPQVLLAMWILADCTKGLRPKHSLCSVLDDRNRQGIEEPHVPASGRPRNSLNLLDVRDRPGLPFREQGTQDGGLGVSMDARPRTTLGERRHEQRRARGGLQVNGLAKIGLRRVVHDEHVGRL